MRAMRETIHIHASAADLLHIRKGNLDWNESHDEETKHIHDLAANLLDIRTGNLDWCKSRHCKKEAREIDCLCCLAKISKWEGSISPSSFYGHLPNC